MAIADLTLSQLLRPELESELIVTRTVLERVPDDRPDWKPHPRAFSMAHLAQLVARLPAWVRITMTETDLDLAPADGPRFPGYSNESTATLLAEFDRNAADARAVLREATNADYDVPWTLKRGGEALLTMPRYRILRWMVLNHLVHHRAQLGMYLRMTDVAVPEMYGPTADSSR
jgi:uncharacterized damage-inducible protein DinB